MSLLLVFAIKTIKLAIISIKQTAYYLTNESELSRQYFQVHFCLSIVNSKAPSVNFNVPNSIMSKLRRPRKTCCLQNQQRWNSLALYLENKFVNLCRYKKNVKLDYGNVILVTEKPFLYWLFVEIYEQYLKNCGDPLKHSKWSIMIIDKA